MGVKIRNFPVKKIHFGEKSEYSNGILQINKEEALRVVRKDEHITDADIFIVHPGDMVRLCPVKDAVEPRCRVDGKPLFPGITTNKLYPAGESVQHALKNCCVIAVGKHWGGFQDGLIDMGGEGAKYSYFSSLINIVLVADTDESFEQREQQKKNRAIRWANLRLAEYLGGLLKDLSGSEEEVFELPPLLGRPGKWEGLPKTILVMQAMSQMEESGYNDLFYGWDTNHILPTFVDPGEILGGAFVAGSFMPSSSTWCTYDMQNYPLIKSLFKAHGKELNFLGVVLSNMNVALEQKERSALQVAQMAKLLGADSAIVNLPAYGNPDADYIACLVALEDSGVKTVGVSNEATGRDGASQPLVTLDEKANALVSTGNVSELIELPPMPRVLGELEALGRDGNSGGWESDELLGPSVRPDGSILMENNGMFCGDMTAGWSTKTVREF